jgi:hypothetical protein
MLATGVEPAAATERDDEGGERPAVAGDSRIALGL